MKRLVLITCIGALLALPATAIARPFPPDSHYQGRVDGDPNTYFGFGTTNSKKHKRVRHLAVALPMNCFNGDRGITEIRMHKSFKVLNLRYLYTHASARAAKAKTGVIITRGIRHIKIFYGEADIRTPQGTGEAYVFGEIRSHGRARGGIHVKTHSDATGKCYSGQLPWRAHRGAHVDYPPGV
jgi:hypothetical protein